MDDCKHCWQKQAGNAFRNVPAFVIGPRTKQFHLLSIHTLSPSTAEIQCCQFCTSINFSAPPMKQSIDWFYKNSCEWTNLLPYSIWFWSTFLIFYCPPLWYCFLCYSPLPLVHKQLIQGYKALRLWTVPSVWEPGMKKQFSDPKFLLPNRSFHPSQKAVMPPLWFCKKPWIIWQYNELSITDLICNAGNQIPKNLNYQRRIVGCKFYCCIFTGRQFTPPKIICINTILVWSGAV